MSNTIRALRVRGVALIVSSPRQDVLVLQEQQTKAHLGKYAGMFSPPMETSYKGERDCSALTRLVDEELPGLADHITIERKRCGVYRIVPGAWVSLYIGQTQSTVLPTLGKGSEEVGGHLWISPENALGLWLRQGAREMLSDFIGKRSGIVCRHCLPINCAYQPCG